MPAFTISTLTFLLLLAGSCGTYSRTGAPKASPGFDPKQPWSIDFKTSGGFIGIGKGNININSDGRYNCSHNNKDQVVSGVTGTLYPRQLQPISEAVAKLDPKGWNKPSLNVAAADAFGYKLEFTTGKDNPQLFSAQWYDNTADQLPDDLKRLDTVLEDIMKKGCVGPP